jgi:tetratricopeptide (TPR) repeat protein
MHTRSFGTRLALIVTVSLPLTACQYVDQLKAIRTFKDANLAYQRQAYPEAVELYEEVLANDPNLTIAHFYLANSYDQQYRPSLRGERENQAFLEKAIDHYISSVDLEANVEMRKLSMQYLVAAFGPDKANQPAKSEPVLEQMIESDPSNPDNYFVLAKLYEDSGLFDEAEGVLNRVRDIRADDPAVYMQVAGFYNRNEEFDKTIQALSQRAALEPDNPEAFYTIGTFYWEKAFRDFLLTDEEKGEFIMLGLEQLDTALNLNQDYVEALTYKNILLRLQANLTEDLDEREALLEEADTLRDRAEELLQAQRGGAS